MTYCLGIKVNEGLVFASDSRTNAGLDNVGSYSKMFTYNVGDRAFVIMTAGNLATSQAVYHRIQKDLDSASPKINLNLCQDLEEVAEYIGEISLECQKIGNDIPLVRERSIGIKFYPRRANKNQSPNIILIYPEGNHIHVSEDSPFVQIGETKYGKPILDRTIMDTPLGDTARAALLSLDSTMRSDLTVGPPIDFVVFKKDQINLDFQDRLKLDSPFFKKFSNIWHDELLKAINHLPRFNWEDV